MSGEDMTERDVITTKFPLSELQICLFVSDVFDIKLPLTKWVLHLNNDIYAYISFSKLNMHNYNENSCLVLNKWFCECAPGTIKNYTLMKNGI